MIEFQDNCVGPCPQGCMGPGCPKRHEAVLVCDSCESECEELYDYEGEQLCKDCLLEAVPKVEI